MLSVPGQAYQPPNSLSLNETDTSEENDDPPGERQRESAPAASV